MKSREMTRGRMMARFAVLIGVWLGTSGSVAFCSFQSGPGAGTPIPVPDPPVPTPQSGDIFGSSLTLRDSSGAETRSFVFGEPIRLDFEIVNLTNERQTVPFSDGQDHDFVVVTNGTTQIRWKWSQNMAFTQAESNLVFEPNASKTYSLYWPGTLADGTQLPAGTYQARGALLFPGFRANPLAEHEMASQLETFNVR
jgi:hypothetical protein